MKARFTGFSLSLFAPTPHHGRFERPRGGSSSCSPHGFPVLLLVLFLTLIEVAFGMSGVLLFVPKSALGPGFGKTNGAIIFFCLLGPVLLAPRMLPDARPDLLMAIQIAGGFALAFLFLYFFYLNFDRERLQRKLLALAVGGQILLIVLTCRLLADYFHGVGSGVDYGPSVAQLMWTLNTGVFASGLLLGTVTMAMMIGHWYLVIPGLAIKWLKGACLAYGGAVALKALAVLLSLIIGTTSNPFGLQGFTDVFRTDMLTMLFFLVRVIVGLAIPAVFCVMAYRAAAIRSTQSSAGILFPAMIVVFLGEMIGTYLIIGFAGLAI